MNQQRSCSYCYNGIVFHLYPIINSQHLILIDGSRITWRISQHKMPFSLFVFLDSHHTRSGIDTGINCTKRSIGMLSRIYR